MVYPSPGLRGPSHPPQEISRAHFWDQQIKMESSLPWCGASAGSTSFVRPVLDKQRAFYRPPLPECFASILVFLKGGTQKKGRQSSRPPHLVATRVASVSPPPDLWAASIRDNIVLCKHSQDAQGLRPSSPDKLTAEAGFSGLFPSGKRISKHVRRDRILATFVTKVIALIVLGLLKCFPNVEKVLLHPLKITKPSCVLLTFCRFLSPNPLR